MDPGLIDPVVARIFRPNGKQISGAVPTHMENRVHDRQVGHPEPMQQHGDRIHQHCAVVGDHLQRGTESARVVVRVDRDAALPRGPMGTESIVRAQ